MVDQSNLPEPIIAEPRTTGVKAGLAPVVNERSEPIHFPSLETAIGAAGNSDDNLRRNSSDDIISISSTSSSESHETHFDEAAVPSPNTLNITTSAPDADVETTTSTNTSVNNPDPLNQANTIVEATAEPHHLVPNFSAEPAQASEPRADYLAMIAQNGLKKKLEMSDSVPPGSVQQVAPRSAHHTEDNTREPVTTYADYNRQPPPVIPAGDTTTSPRRAEPFRVPNPNFQHQGPSTPQVENRSNNSAIPAAQSQSQPQPNPSPVPYHPTLRPKVVQEQPSVQDPDLRRAGQHVPSPRWGNQGTAPHANHFGAPHPQAPHPQAPYQGFPYLHQPGNPWRSVNGPR